MIKLIQFDNTNKNSRYLPYHPSQMKLININNVNSNPRLIILTHTLEIPDQMKLIKFDYININLRNPNPRNHNFYPKILTKETLYETYEH